MYNLAAPLHSASGGRGVPAVDWDTAGLKYSGYASVLGVPGDPEVEAMPMSHVGCACGREPCDRFWRYGDRGVRTGS